MVQARKILGGGLRLFTSALYFLSFCAAAIILGIFSYFLAKLHGHHLGISKYWQAVEGMAGVAVIYTGLAMLMVCCLGGKTFAAILGLIGDLLICGAFIAIAIIDRSGAYSRTGLVTTPLGSGQAATTGAAGTNLGLAARLNTTTFACAVAGAGLMAIAFLMQLAMWRNHKKEKPYGPGPDNDYTSGKRSLFARKPRRDVEEPFGAEKEVAPVPIVVAPTVDREVMRNDIRPSHDTGMTGTTAGGFNDNAPNKYHNETPAPGTIVATSHYTTPGVYDPTYRGDGTTNANF